MEEGTQLARGYSKSAHSKGQKNSAKSQSRKQNKPSVPWAKAPPKLNRQTAKEATARAKSNARKAKTSARKKEASASKTEPKSDANTRPDGKSRPSTRGKKVKRRRDSLTENQDSPGETGARKGEPKSDANTRPSGKSRPWGKVKRRRDSLTENRDSPGETGARKGEPKSGASKRPKKSKFKNKSKHSQESKAKSNARRRPGNERRTGKNRNEGNKIQKPGARRRPSNSRQEDHHENPVHVCCGQDANAELCNEKKASAIDGCHIADVSDTPSSCAHACFFGRDDICQLMLNLCAGGEGCSCAHLMVACSGQCGPKSEYCLHYLANYAYPNIYT